MIFKKTLFKKKIPALIATSWSRLTTSLSLTPAQLLQTVLLGSGVTATKSTYNGVPLVLSSQAGRRIVLLITEK
ncbi:MAG: hypothetical protein V4549_13180 [Bacteroidota bacterium]